ncbi:MAG: 50S ribosomal protein L21 [Patescibacteria group bacterium]
MKIAVIKTGGKQYVVKEKDKIKIEKIGASEGVEFDALLVADGDKVEIGAPILAAKVKAKVIGISRTRKVVGVKYKPKTREHKKFGHRQQLTEVEIIKI